MTAPLGGSADPSPAQKALAECRQAIADVRTGNPEAALLKRQHARTQKLAHELREQLNEANQEIERLRRQLDRR